MHDSHCQWKVESTERRFSLLEQRGLKPAYSGDVILKSYIIDNTLNLRYNVSTYSLNVLCRKRPEKINLVIF